ncbi:snRNA-activating protein complex subunit 1-like [Centruroides vittatus]|uniref:snRNA-activating protein complex subunit 1-like n=1 Tax=Centruroides vittatus TaxID=120091 RepID=UPI00350E9B12
MFSYSKNVLGSKILSCILYWRILFVVWFYKKQLTKPPQRIRMQMEEWRFVINLMQICKEKKMYDVNYLFYTLCKENAFHFVYNSKMFGPKISLSDTNVIEQEARWKEILMPMNSLAYNGELNQISTIHEKYQKLKESFEPSTSNSLSLIKSNVTDDALHEIKKFLENINETVYKTKVNKTNDENNEEEREQQESEEENIGRHRADLKEKGFFRDLSISRTRRSVLEIENKETSKKSRLSYEKGTESSDDND